VSDRRRPLLTRDRTGTRRFGTVIALTALALAVAGCSSKPPDAVTVAGSALGTESASPSSVSPASGLPTPTPAPDPLTKAQATAALPPASVLGKGWKVTKNATPSTGSSKDKVTPAACAVIFDKLDADWVGKPVTKAERSYTAGKFGPYASSTVSSYSTPPPAGAFDTIAAALGKCPKFISTDAKGAKTAYTVQPLKFPNVGDQTFAFALTAVVGSKSFSIMLTAQFAVAIVGANSVTVTNAAFGKKVAPGVTLSLMKATMARLP
jgi:hypothetical protein